MGAVLSGVAAVASTASSVNSMMNSGGSGGGGGGGGWMPYNMQGADSAFNAQQQKLLQTNPYFTMTGQYKDLYNQGTADPYAQGLQDYANTAGTMAGTAGQMDFSNSQNLTNYANTLVPMAQGLVDTSWQGMDLANQGLQQSRDAIGVAQNGVGYANQGMGTAGQIVQNAFDPQQALYNRTAQQLTDQTRASQAARGILMSGQGAGLENEALNNFNIDWQNNQLQREIQGQNAWNSAQAGYNAATGQLNSANSGLQNADLGWQRALAGVGNAQAGYNNAVTSAGNDYTQAGALAGQGVTATGMAGSLPDTAFWQNQQNQSNNLNAYTQSLMGQEQARQQYLSNYLQYMGMGPTAQDSNTKALYGNLSQQQFFNNGLAGFAGSLPGAFNNMQKGWDAASGWFGGGGSGGDNGGLTYGGMGGTSWPSGAS